MPSLHLFRAKVDFCIFSFHGDHMNHVNHVGSKGNGNSFTVGKSRMDGENGKDGIETAPAEYAASRHSEGNVRVLEGG